MTDNLQFIFVETKGIPLFKFHIHHNTFVPEIIEKVNTQIAGHTYGRLFAVVMMEKHQHKVSRGKNNNVIRLLRASLIQYGK